MPLKKKKALASEGKGCKKIDSFFQSESGPRTRAETKRNAEESASIPPAKRPAAAAAASLPVESPNDVSSGEPEGAEQSRAEQNKLEAEAKLLAKRFRVKKLGPSWVKALLTEFKKPYLTELMDFVEKERASCTVYPPAEDVFTWTTWCPIQEVKVIVLGQDPYHRPNQAHGLCFSVRVGVSVPPSLQNMYKELKNDIKGFTIPSHGYLAGWAKQGVLLLNACLTVREGSPNSHAGKGWEKLTDAVIHWINRNLKSVVFLLWGSYAQKKAAFIDQGKHLVLKSPHPSPLSASRGFLGNKHFSKANAYLEESGKSPINWSYLPATLEE